MLITLLIAIRRPLHLEDIVTTDHLDLLARLVVLTSLVVGYSYATEISLALTEPARDAERSTFVYRATGHYAPLFWTMATCNCGLPLLLLVRRIRRTTWTLLTICLLVNLGMWLERWVIIVTSLSHDRLPFQWRFYSPTWVEWALTFGALGWFLLLMLVGLKVLPPISIAELKEAAEEKTEEDAPSGAEVSHVG
jgi:molybdopterin-containing oxidoreductase family membrane subunit